MRIRPTVLFAIALLGLLAGGCSDQPGEGPQGAGKGAAEAPPAPSNPLGFEVWHDDFPGAPDLPHLSPRRSGLWYDRTRRQALESVVAHLSGTCTKDAWWMAKDFFSRSDEDAVDALVLALDRGLQVPENADHVENIVEAIGRARAPQAAEALLRALEHPREAIRNKVMFALIGSGTPATIRQARGMFRAVNGRGMEGWVKAALAHLPPEEAAVDFAAILADPQLGLMREVVVQATLELPPAIALRVFEPMIGHEPPDLLAPITGLRHAAGDAGGTSLLADLLRRPEPQTRAAAVQALRVGGAEELLDQVLRLTTDPDPMVRMEVVGLLSGIHSEHVDLALESMAADEAVDVRRAALLALAQRGQVRALDELVEVIRTGTGSRMRLAIQDLLAARYGGAVPAIAARMAEAPPGERLEYLRAIALTTAPEAFGPLRDVFLGEDAFARENRSFAAYLMTNARGAEDDMLELFRSLPRADYRRRAMLMGTLANVAADRESEEIATPIYALFRAILADREEIPQVRLLALGYLRRDLRIDDMEAVKRMLADEEEPMRKALTDFLFEFF